MFCTVLIHLIILMTALGEYFVGYTGKTCSLLFVLETFQSVFVQSVYGSKDDKKQANKSYADELE